MDLRVWLAESRVVDLLELVDQLPAACRLNEAIAQDDEAADELLAMSGDSNNEGAPDWSPRVSEFDLPSMMLAAAINELKVLVQTVIAANGGQPTKVRPFPTPKTAIDRARERQDLELFRAFEERFGFGRKADN